MSTKNASFPYPPIETEKDALLHLRSSSHPIKIWADAICINQSDTAERNRQVSLMSFIYTRAGYAVVWLGTKNHTVNQPAPFSSSGGPAVYRSMFLEWKAGPTQHLAAGLVPHPTVQPPRIKIWYSPKPPQATLMRLAKSTYWTRLWVVQEVCLPRSLLVVYGSDIWAYEEFQGWVQVGNGKYWWRYGRAASETPAPTTHRVSACGYHHGSYAEATGNKREEAYQHDGTGEPGGEFGGWVGAEAGSVEYYANAGEGCLAAREGHSGFVEGRLQPVYDLWRSVVGFVFHHTKTIGGKTGVGYLKDEERRITIVRTAGIIQRALGQKLDEELCSTERPQPDPEAIGVVGHIAGEILRIGPGYGDLQLSTLRQLDEEYMTRIFEYEGQDLGRIRNIPDPFAIGSRILVDRRPEEDKHGAPMDGTARSNSDLSHSISSEQESFYIASDEEGRHVDGDARISLGTGYFIGLVPPAAKEGDIVVRFWNCSAAIIKMYMLVGRADVASSSADASDETTTSPPEHDMQFERCAAMARGAGGNDAAAIRPAGYREEYSRELLGAIYVDIGLRTLQMITASLEV
ncbi:uncharacterized protein QC761_105550 [Podospora bellae-mahoneyi]|uniref:Heterokaryon incompatibility domain-containing protein n=1 Tax=Podospora bellae-mahoneyi TaxID=2093777 RepID=A0ABR0FXM0_9PEZI|nr:hypothetical protein QC761_105550 [Podospora bellae-mahoneyi]